MPKPRNKENRGLPMRWQWTRGAYYYRVPEDLKHKWDGKDKFRLGKTLPEAFKVWASRINHLDKAQTIDELFDRYALEVVPTKAPRTRIDNLLQIRTLRKVFGAMPLESIKPVVVYRYVDKRSAKIAARREVALLSHALTKAVEWGYIDRHPFKGEVRFTGEKNRDRYVEDWEIAEIMALQPKRKGDTITVVQAYIRLKLLIGLRRGDLLRLTVSHLKDDGIHIKTSKTGKAVIFAWSDELRAAVDACKAARPRHIAPWLFCTRRGESYLNEATGGAEGWSSLWDRFMRRAMAETGIKERFTEHDLRAKAGSDAESTERASALLTHASTGITKRVYRRKAEVVQPLK